ncbi:MAG: sigma-70 family RNA polymerase sigma factor [Candidatus Cloacimonadales bacterium]
MKNRLEELFAQEGRKVFNYLRKILRNPEDAEDILQETFVAVYAKLESVEAAALPAYLFRTAYHKALNRIRQRQKDANYNLNLTQPEIVQAPEMPEDSVEQNREIRAALSQLSGKDASLLELKYFQKKSYREIAEILDLTESAVDSGLVRARAKLKKIIVKRRKSSKLVSAKSRSEETKWKDVNSVKD